MRIFSGRIMFFSVFLIVLFIGQAVAQQNLPFIRVSPPAKVVQGVGFATIKIDYSRPGVKGRDVYGKLVPYGLAPNPFGNGKPMPWRAGANENTTFYLSHDAKVNGQPLAAGKYGLHMIVMEDEWTIIFNTDNNGWGSYFYDKENDALRIKVKPQTVEHKEWLEYGFENLSSGSCDVYMHWGKKKVPFTVAFDEHEVVLGKYREELTGRAGFNQAAWGGAARYCLQNEVNMEEAMTWIDKALSMNGGDNFNNKVVKAGLLAAMGKEEEGNKLMESSMDDATEAELNMYGYQLMNQGNLDEAIRIFKLNIQRHPDSWNVYDSLGEALNNKGDKAAAKKNYEKAYEMAPANQKARIEAILKKM